MTKKKIDFEDYIPAASAAAILSDKLHREIKPGYIHRIKRVRRLRINKTSLLYHKEDIQGAQIRQRFQV